ncbi:MAG: DUF692 family multinuclear iron-containing protein [Frankia sp.]
MTLDTPRADAPATGPATATDPLTSTTVIPGDSTGLVSTGLVAPAAGRRRVPDRRPLGGLGIGWRPELAEFIRARADRLGFVEVVAEAIHRRPDGARHRHCPEPEAPPGLDRVALPTAVHGVRLSLGGTTPLEPGRVRHLADVASRFGASIVSEHVAFVRAGGLEAGHLLPVPRTRDALAVLTRNTRTVMAELDAPFALEHVAALAAWPEDEFGEADFLAELLERTGALLLLDLANLHAHARNHGTDPRAFLDRLPLERVAYTHIAGGVEQGGLYHDTHLHPVRPPVVDLVAELGARCAKLPPIMLERDGRYPTARELDAELATIARHVGPDPTGGRGSGRAPAPRPRPRRSVLVGTVPTRPAASGRPVGDRMATLDPTGVPASLTQRQEALVRALVADGPGPAGMAADRVAATRDALLRKRTAEVAAVWPALSTTGGFADRFAAFASGRVPAGPWADGLAFAGAVLADLGDDARAELALARLRRRPGALRLVAGARLGWHIAVYIPTRGARVFSLVLPGRPASAGRPARHDDPRET